MKTSSLAIASLFLLLAFCLSADEKMEGKSNLCQKEPIEEEMVEVESSIIVEGKEVKYKVKTGTILLKEDSGSNRAALFYMAYTRNDLEDNSNRPITFCFNGGPGSSSVWLHLGFLGPKRVVTEGIGVPVHPYRLENNSESLLDITDLVFIDPVSTGYSRVVPGVDEKKFHGVDEDIESVSEFIRIYMTREARWTSPKYIAAESYGGIRAIGVADYLYENHNMFVNGLILIAPAIDLQTIDFSRGNDLAYVTFLPSYVATAWYHQKLSPQLQGDRAQAIAESTRFAASKYLSALYLGNDLHSSERENIVQALSQFTTFSGEELQKANLRITGHRFQKGLLRNQGELVGRFDSRFKGIEIDEACQYCQYDPSLDAIMGPFTALFNQYVHKDLQWKKDLEYKVLTNVFPWNWGKASNKYLNMTNSLRELMMKNPSLKVFVATGIYDLAIPFSATMYTIDHLDLPESIKGHIVSKKYEAGHMIYLDPSEFLKLRKDTAEFILNSRY